jgi:hypothetical protein
MIGLPAIRWMDALTKGLPQPSYGKAIICAPQRRQTLGNSICCKAPDVTSRGNEIESGQDV